MNEEKIVLVELDDDGEPMIIAQYVDLHEIARGECGVVMTCKRSVGLYNED